MILKKFNSIVLLVSLFAFSLNLNIFAQERMVQECTTQECTTQECAQDFDFSNIQDQESVDTENFFDDYQDPQIMHDLINKGTASLPEELKKEILSVWDKATILNAKIYGLGEPVLVTDTDLITDYVFLLQDMIFIIDDKSFIDLAIKLASPNSILKLQTKLLDEEFEQDVFAVNSFLESYIKNEQVFNSLNSLAQEKLKFFKNCIYALYFGGFNAFAQVFTDKINIEKDQERIENAQTKKAINQLMLNLNNFLNSENITQEQTEAAIYIRDIIFDDIVTFVNKMVDDNGNIGQIQGADFMPQKSNFIGFNKDTFLQEANEKFKDLKKEPLFVAAYNKVDTINNKLNNLSNKTYYANSLLVNSYSLYNKFLSFYIRDNKTIPFLHSVGNSLAGGFIFPVFVLKKLAELNKKEHNVLTNFYKLNIMKLDKIEDIKLEDLKNLRKDLNELSNANIFTELYLLHKDHNFLARNFNWLGKSIFRIGSAFAYYNLYAKSRIPGCKNNDGSNVGNNYWPTDFNHLNMAIYKSMLFGGFTLGNRLTGSLGLTDINIMDKMMALAPNDVTGWHTKKDANQVKELKEKLLNAHNRFKNIENYSLGIIGPDLIQFLTTTFMPVFTDKYFPKNIANLDLKTLFAKENLIRNDITNINLTDIFTKNKSIINFFQPIYFDYYVGNRDLQHISNEQYIKNRIYGYLSEKVGGHIGGLIGKRFNKPVNVIVAKIITKFFDEAFLTDEYKEFIENSQDKFINFSETDKKIAFVKSFLKDNILSFYQFKNINTQVNYIYEFLLNLLQYSQILTPLQLAEFEISLAKQQYIQSTLAYSSSLLGIIQLKDSEINLDSSFDLLNKFEQDNNIDKQLDLFVDGILQGMSKKISQTIGSFVGSFVTKSIVDYLLNRPGTPPGGASGATVTQPVPLQPAVQS